MLKLLLISSLLVSIALGAENESKLTLLIDTKRSGDKLVKRVEKLKQPAPKNSGYIIKNFSIKTVKHLSTITFKIDTQNFMKFDLYPESGVYIFCGSSPENAKLVSVSNIGGDVKIVLPTSASSKRWFIAGSRGNFFPAEILTKKTENKSQQSNR